MSIVQFSHSSHHHMVSEWIIATNNVVLIAEHSKFCHSSSTPLYNIIFATIISLGVTSHHSRHYYRCLLMLAFSFFWNQEKQTLKRSVLAKASCTNCRFLFLGLFFVVAKCYTPLLLCIYNSVLFESSENEFSTRKAYYLHFQIIIQ